MKFDLKELIITTVVYLTIDIFYITSNTKYFKKYFKYLQNSPAKFRQIPAMITYIILALGLYYFIIKERKPILDAFLFGLLIYGVYDFTNYSTITKWTLDFAIKDTLWGGTVFAISTFIIYEIIKRI